VQSVDYPAVSVDMQPQKVSKQVYYVQGKAGVATDNEGFISNAAFVLTDKGVVVIDTLGTPSLARLLVQKIRQITDKPIVKVIITHYHADHIYGLQVFKELGAEIIAPAGYADYLDAPLAKQRLEERQTSLAPWINQDTYLITPDKVIDANTSFTLGGVDFDINYLGSAHSDGDLTLLVKTDKVLITGDIIFEGRVPFTGNANTKHWLTLLENLEHETLNALIPGHGPSAKDPNAAIQLTLNYLRKIRQTMQAAVEELIPFDEAYAEVDWSEYEKLPAFKAAHRKNVYGVYLSLEAESLKQ